MSLATVRRVLGRPMKYLCPGCQQETRDGRDYLGPECWSRLPKATQEALYRRDGFALKRYRQLLDALRAGTPLEEIQIG